MTDKERIVSHELDPQWAREMEEAIIDALTLYDEPQEHDLPGHRIIDFTPSSMGVDERYEYSKLTPKEKEFIQLVLYRQLNFNLETAPLVAAQEVNTPYAEIQGKRRESVYETPWLPNKAYVHVVTFVESGEIDGWFIAPKEFVL